MQSQLRARAWVHRLITCGQGFFKNIETSRLNRVSAKLRSSFFFGWFMKTLCNNSSIVFLYNTSPKQCERNADEESLSSKQVIQVVISNPQVSKCAAWRPKCLWQRQSHAPSSACVKRRRLAGFAFRGFITNGFAARLIRCWLSI